MSTQRANGATVQCLLARAKLDMLEQARQHRRRFIAAWTEVQLRMNASPLSIPHVAFVAFVHKVIPTIAFSGELVEVSAINIAASIVLEMQNLLCSVMEHKQFSWDIPCRCSS